MKYVVDYTEKPFNGVKHELFKTMKAAKAFVNKNKETLYWHCIRVRNPKSNYPKAIISEDSDLSGYTRIEGTLETYHETGMECTAIILYDNSIRGEPNPHFDSTKPEDENNFRYYKTLEATHFIENEDILEIEGTKFFMMNDAKFAKDDGYRFGFYPRGFSRREIISLFYPEKKKAVLWKPIKQ